MFIGQSLRSDYCAVYATAMWLSLCGAPVGRRQAQRWFGVQPATWVGASHSHMASVIARHLPQAVGHWQHLRPGTPQALAAAAGAALAAGRPVLATACCELRQPLLRCQHAFVITACRAGRIELLDPLGRSPGRGDTHNAWIEPTAGAPRRLDVQGAAWRLDLGCRVSLFVPDNCPLR